MLQGENYEDFVNEKGGGVCIPLDGNIPLCERVGIF